MKILMSAFACGPGQGSEAGIGWNWAVEVAKIGHSVCVVTQSEFAERIAAEMRAGQVPESLSVDIFMPRWLERLRDFGLRSGMDSTTWSVVHLIWQLLLPAHVRRRHGGDAFDLVHHVTIGTIRYPTLMWRLGLPLVLGPLGGGERSPPALRKSLRLRQRIIETIRDAHTWITRFDPVTQAAYRHARVILARTSASKESVPRRLQQKVHVHVGIGHDVAAAPRPVRRAADTPLALLYAGRLLGWKGLHLAIDAVALARAANVDATLTIIGDGPARASLEQRARAAGVAEFIVWRKRVARAELLECYANHHALLFPSLHDSGGLVVLESFARGVPVICLDLGGPGEMVDESCGRVIATRGRDEAEVSCALSEAIGELAHSEELRLHLARGACLRAGDYSWEKVVGALYAHITAHLELRPDAAQRTASKDRTAQPAPEGI